MNAETNGRAGQPRIELYVRSFDPAGARECQEQTIDRLNRLAENDTISDVSVNVWGKRFRTDTAAARTKQGRHIHELIRELKRWARQAGVSLHTLEQTERQNSRTEGDPNEVINFPVMLLVEYVDDNIVSVAPCSTDGDRNVGVEDRLNRLESQETTTRADIYSEAVAVGGESQ